MAPAKSTASSSKSASTASAAPLKKAAPVPLPPTFSTPQAHKAVDALLAHLAKVTKEREETELIPRDEHVFLIVNTKKGTTKRKLMPVRVQLPHPPLPPPPQTSVCLITKPPQRTYKDLLASPAHNIKFVNRVVDTDKLRGKWRPYEARRNLLRENDVFLCDDRVVGSMSGLLGKGWFEAKKQPIPVNLARKDLKAELGRAISSTYFHPTTGTSHSIRLSTPPTSTAQQTLDNLLAALPQVMALIEGGWDNVLSVGVKTSTSVMLPVWSGKLEGRFVEEGAAKGGNGDVQMEEEVEVEGKKGKKGKAVEEPKKAAAPTPTSTTSGEAAKKGPKKATTGGAEGQGQKKKKSSTIGSGGAAKKIKAGVVGKAVKAK